MISIEKAILADICLGIPLGKIMFSVPGHLDPGSLPSAPETFLFRGEQLALMKSLFEQGDDNRIAAAVSELTGAADAAMREGPFSVTQKPHSRFSQDPRDYQSLAKYWWPNPSTLDSLPYVNRDGEVNPECYSEDFDYVRLGRFSETVVLLALAAYLTGRADYARRAVALLETWFVDPATRQNPNFALAQNTPGKTATRWQSVIEARFLVYVTEAVRLLSGSNALNSATHEKIRAWFSELLAWLLESEHGRRAKLARNNIGFWYDLQCMVYAQFCGRAELVERIIRDDMTPRLKAQMDADGSLPNELGRAYPKDYVAFTLAAMVLISRVGEHAGLELWDERQSDGHNFRVAHDWLARAGGAGKLLAAVEPPGPADGDPFRELGFLLDTGVKLRAFQRIADTEARAASALKAENGLLQHGLDQAQERLQTHLAEIAALTQTLAQIEALDAALESTRADLKASRLQLEEAREERRQTASMARRLLKDREALLDHAAKLEAGYRAVLASTSWRATGPARVAMRKLKSLLTGRKSRRNHIPLLPTLSAIGSGDIAARPAAPAWSGGKDEPSSTPPRSKARTAPAPARVADRIKAMARENLPPAAKEAVKAMLEATPRKQAVMNKLSGMTARVKPPAADPLQTLLAARPRDEEALRREYRQKGLDREPDTFVLYRIIGNDLYPRHKKGQSRENVRFILENEPELAGCQKRWVVNRIIDPGEERQIIAMLEAHGQPFLHIPFVAEEYRRIGWDFDALPAPGYLAGAEFRKLGPEQQDRARTALYRLKNNYVMNNNGARNASLRDGRGRAKWVLPWDGNGFVTAKAWQEISQAVVSRPHLKYFAVPMERVTDNSMLLRDDFTPHPVEEPQLLFRRDAGEAFNEDFPYGRRPKVELFWRLGIPGPWDRWNDDPWEQKRREPSSEAFQFGVAGWVARMNSGAGALEQKDKASFKNRGLARQEAIVAAIDHVDGVHPVPGNLDDPIFYTAEALDRLAKVLLEGGGDMLPLARKIIGDAERTLGEAPYSVIQKTTLPPSGDPHDYWHPAPYWWPNPEKKDGLPYIRKDGQRVPGTRMYEPESAQYDRTRLQLMFDGTVALALGWRLTSRADFAAHGAKLVRTWFLDPATRMNPHLRYSQVRRGHNRDEGYGTGIIEFKDLYYFLDAVRLLEKSGAFSRQDSDELKTWLRTYLEWLETSRQGMKEAASINNHGTYFDLQTAAIAAYLGEKEKQRDIFLRTQSRITQQFTEAGEQPDEMKRSITQHYVFFNLQGWLNIFQLARASGLPTGDWETPPHSRVAAAFRWIVGHDMANWPHEQIEPFDTERLYPLALSARNVGILGDDELTRLIGGMPFSQRKSIFDPHDAVMPYWNEFLCSGC